MILNSAQRPAHPKVLIFDMDGTITRPFFDFDGIRAELNITGGTILEALETMPPDQRQRAWAILEEHERVAARESELHDGVMEVLDYLQERGIRTAVATRNSRRSVDTVLQKHALRFDLLHSREDGPVKPSPEPVRAICRQFGVQPLESWIIGDYLYDIQSGNAAGAVTVLKLNDDDLPEYAPQATHRVRHMIELIDLLGNGALS